MASQIYRRSEESTEQRLWELLLEISHEFFNFKNERTEPFVSCLLTWTAFVSLFSMIYSSKQADILE